MYVGEEGFMKKYYVPLCEARKSIGKRRANQTFYDD